MSSVSKEQKARLFDQISTIMKLVVDGKRDPDEVSRVLQEIISPTKKPLQLTELSSHTSAREIMGRNFLDIAEALRHYNIAMTGDQHELLVEIPFSESTLRECKDTHVLVADFGLSILKVRKCVDRELFYFRKDAWYNDEQFARKKSEPRWRLIRKDMVPSSTSKTWQEQCELLEESEEVPTARAMVYVIILNYLATGERMFEDTYVRTNSVRSDGSHVDVGDFDLTGLRVASNAEDNRRVGLGVASSRK